MATTKSANLKAQLWAPGSLRGITLFTSRKTVESFPPHFHDFYVIATNDVSGDFLCSCERKAFDPHGFALLNPYQVHGWNASQTRHEYRACYVPSRLVGSLLGSNGSQSPGRFFRRPVVQAAALAARFREAHAALEPANSSRVASDDLLDVIIRLVSRFADAEDGRASSRGLRIEVERTRNRIIEGYEQNLSLDTLARNVDLSKYHLIKLFKNEVGLTPHQFLIQVRVEQAKEKLESGEALADVALATGFCQQSHFTEHFRRLVGVTPGAYVAACRETE